MGRTRAGTRLAAAVVVLAAGCGTGGTPDGGAPSPRTPAGAAAASDVAGCSERPPDHTWETDGTLPADFEPVEVRQCAPLQSRVFPGEGEWIVVEERRSTGPGLDELAAALSDPTPVVVEGGGCRLNLDSSPAAVLVDEDGRAFRPEFPRDGCNHLTTRVRAAYDELSFEPVAYWRVQPVRSAFAGVTGCEDGWKDIIAIDVADGVERKDRSPAVRTPGITRVCVYETNPADPIAGVLLTGRALAAGESDALRSRLDGHPPVTPCERPHTRFAVVRTATDEVYVELDGCRRLMSGAGWSQPSQDVVDAVSAVGAGRRSGRAIACDDEHARTADVDGDGRADVVAHDFDDTGTPRFVTTVCVATGYTIEAADLGAESFEVTDVGGDGRSEILLGGTAAFSGGMTAYAVVDRSLVPVVVEGKALSVRWGRETAGPSADEATGGAEWGCRDVDGDGAAELVQVVVDYRDDVQTSTAYRIDGRRAKVVDETSTPIDPDRTEESDDPGPLVPACPGTGS